MLQRRWAKRCLDIGAVGDDAGVVPTVVEVVRSTSSGQRGRVGRAVYQYCTVSRGRLDAMG